ncbi:DUF4192 domain-containing protein [Salinactinospora qingdaonensis]|uniref:DUF4192 domain-containing protein n=1 Tax=Salinactinospora qingdaonensis TaxID=702744 RepID=A0ABP7EX58_9ACTN
MVTNGEFDSVPSLSLQNPVDVIAAIPYLVGFHPSDSLVVLGIVRDSTRVGFAAQCELPEPSDDPDPTAGPSADDVGSDTAATVARQGCDRALLVAYGSADRVTPRLEAAERALTAAGVEVCEMLRVAEGRYWSYLCSQECCPSEGRPYDVGSSTIPATAVVAGMSALPGREDVAASIAPVNGERRELMHRATLAAEARCARMWGSTDSGGHTDFATALRIEGVRTVRAVVADALAGRMPEDPDHLAWLGVVLVAPRVRDEAWAHIRADQAATHVALWRYVLRHVDEGPYAAAPGGLLAFSAWLANEPALADAALDRVHAVDPGYSMAALIRYALRQGVSPRQWRHLTPEWLEEHAPIIRPRPER